MPTPRHAWRGLLTRLHGALTAVLASSDSGVPKARLHRLGDAFVGTFPADRLEFYHVLVKAGEEYLWGEQPEPRRNQLNR